jgi:PPK2 family polyphosphate:nucleotide phosphotransferase
MKINPTDFRVREGGEVNLKKWPTSVDPVYRSKKQYRELLGEHVARLSELQQLLYASNAHAVLLIFQAMDAAAKDGAIKHVMSGVNPQGCQVFSFKRPSPTELQHDFLWRTTRDLPERGRIGIFNRSYYEEVLIVRVHPDILRGEGLPDALLDKKTVWHDRYRSIVDLERHLSANGTRIIKFYLHLSKEEQRKRFLQRIDEPEKNWKFGLADIEERNFWKQYMKAYEDCLSATSTRQAPWYVVPADDKENARLIVSQIVLDTLEGLKMTYPKTGAARQVRALRSTSAGAYPLKSGAGTALFRPERRGKSEHGSRVAADTLPAGKPAHAKVLELDPRMSSEAVLQHAGRACLDHLLRNEESALSGDTEGIHQMRVAERRLRAILSAFAPVLPKKARRWASSELRWFADVLGEARNIDVFSASLLRPARAALPGTGGFKRLAMATRNRRKAAHAAVVEAIHSTRYKESVLAMLRWFDEREWRTPGALDDLQRPIGELAPILLDRSRDQAKKHSKHFAKQSAKKRHRLRIALKKLRYAAELLEGLYDPAETQQFVQRLERLQDDLGDINDVRVGRDIVAMEAGRGGTRDRPWPRRAPRARLAEASPR